MTTCTRSTDGQSGKETAWAVGLSGNQRWENIVRLYQRVLDQWRNSNNGSNQESQIVRFGSPRFMGGVCHREIANGKRSHFF
jgi:hypothetical protein